MKRDMDLCRQILLKIEECEETMISDHHQFEADLEKQNYTQAQIGYHVKPLHKANLLEAIDLSSMRLADYFIPKSITWQGHEFLENARNDTIWEKAKSITMKKGVGLTLDTLQALLVKLTKDTLGLGD